MPVRIPRSAATSGPRPVHFGQTPVPCRATDTSRSKPVQAAACPSASSPLPAGGYEPPIGLWMILMWCRNCATCKTSGFGRAILPDLSREKFPKRCRASRLCGTDSSPRAAGNQRFDRHAAVVGGDRERPPQRQYPLAHPGQAEAELVIRLHAAAIIADAHAREAAICTQPRRLFGRLDADIDGGRPGMTEDVGQGFLNNAVDGQLRGFSGLAERGRDRRFDVHVEMRFTPKTQQGAKRLAKPQLRQPDGAKPLQNPAVELLKRIDLLQDR